MSSRAFLSVLLSKSRHLSLSLLLLVLAPVCGFAQGTNESPSSGTITRAPLNPDFVAYQNEIQAREELRRQGASVETEPAVRPTGRIPSPVDYSFLARQAPAIEGATPPAKYDLRTDSKVTSVKNQGNCGACWAFAAMAALESSLLTAETRDFSENNLNNLNGFVDAPCHGGSASKAAAYLVRWSGPVDETDDPYKVLSKDTTPSSPPGLPVQKHVQKILIFPRRTSPTDNNTLKNALQTYGALHTSMYWDQRAEDQSKNLPELSYNSSTGGYYYYGSSSVSTNHDVALVGWDDNYDKSNFLTPPPGNGAFLIKNSYGTSHGKQGYDWISYYDTKFCLSDESYAYVGSEAVTNYSRKYEYDPLGVTYYDGYNSNLGWFANVFTAAATEQLAAVSFWVPANNSSYTIYVYTGPTSDPITGGTLGGTTTVTIPIAGYQTVPLVAPVQLTQGQKFSVVVRVSAPAGITNPFPMQSAMNGYSSNLPPGPTQVSFIREEQGSGWIGPWKDTTTIDPTANVCLKAFTTANSASGNYPLIVNSAFPSNGVNITVSPLDSAGAGNGTASFTRTYPPGTTVTLTAPANVQGKALNSWTGCDSLLGAACTVIMGSARSVTASYYSASSGALPSNVTPWIENLSPAAVKAGSVGFYLTVEGGGFGYSPGAGVIWNGVDRTSSTIWVSDSQLIVPITSADIATEGAATVAVINPAVGGGVSPSTQFAIDSTSNSVTVTTQFETDLLLTPGDVIDLPVTLNGLAPNARVSLTCLIPPTAAEVTCSYSGGVITITTTENTPTGYFSLVAVFTVTQQVASLGRHRVFLAAWTGLAALPFGLLWMGGSARKKHLLRVWLVLLAVGLILWLAGCGSSSGGSTTSRSSLPITLEVMEP